MDFHSAKQVVMRWLREFSKTGGNGEVLLGAAN
jgi:hypothetical protein